MKAKGRLALLLFNAAVAIAGVAVTFVILRSTSLEISVQGSLRGTQSGSQFLRPQDQRLAMTRPFSTTPQLIAPPQEAVPPESSSVSGEVTGSIGPETWSTEVRPEMVVPPSSWQSTLVRPSPATAPTPARPRETRPERRTDDLTKRLTEIGPTATARLRKRFAAAKAAWPPGEVAFVAIKDQKVLELYARQQGGDWQHIHRYRVLAASGGAGPKLRQGDRQVPEGVYRISYLNPRSAYHVSLRVNYPNRFDRRMAAKEGRRKLGGDIMIHGKRSSAGCLAMGDEAAEELFVLAAETGKSKIRLIIAPTDFRSKKTLTVKSGQPAWLPQLYSEIATAMTEFKAPPPPSMGLLSFFTQ